MVLAPRRQRLNLPIAPLVAALVGGVTALVFALMPVGLLEDFVLDSGIAAVMPAAVPPLGTTARAVLILTGGGGTGLIAWFALFLLLGSRSIAIQRSGAAGEESAVEQTPVLRRADAHPDAPSRRPLFANRDLGTPFLEVRAGRPVHIVAEPEDVEADVVAPPVAIEQDLPADLDLPLAAFDPRAIPEEPVDWFPPPAPLRQVPRQQVFDAGERFETFELTPLVRAPIPDPVWTPAPPASALRQAPPLPPSPPLSPPPPLVQDAAPPPPMPLRAPAPAPVRPRDSARVELDPSASIHALLDRLERGVGRRDTTPPPAREESIEDTLVTLRRLATSR